jgi:hypothetical protein
MPGVKPSPCLSWLHCWHGTGVILTCDPPLRPEVCCRCDAQRSVSAIVVRDAEAHGPYLPKVLA